MTYCIINGELIKASEAQISVLDRGFRYGDGVFETIAIAGGVPYQFEWHVARLQKGLNAIKIPYDTAQLQAYCRQLLHKNNVTDGFLRLQVTRGIGSHGYLPDASHPTLVIETSPTGVVNHQPASLWQSSYSKISPQALPVQYKLCQGLNSTLARMEAIEHECFDALIFNEDGNVCETSSGNIFWCKDDVVYTPSLACGILEGSTRAAVLRLSPGVKEVQATLEQLLEADAVLICNVAWKAIPVSVLLPSGRRWQSESFATYCSQLLDTDRKAYGKSHHNMWQK